jgi:hypothetical protein
VLGLVLFECSSQISEESLYNVTHGLHNANRLPSSIWIENTMLGAKRKCLNEQITSSRPTSPSVSSPFLHPHHSLEARARPCSVDAQQLVSHDVDAKLRPPIIELINRSLQPYKAKMCNMEPQYIAKLVSSDVNEKLKPLVPSCQSPNTPHFQTLV